MGSIGNLKAEYFPFFHPVPYSIAIIQLMYLYVMLWVEL